MIAPARRSHAQAAYNAFDADEHYGYGEFLPGERIGRPLGRGHGRAILRGLIVLIVLGGGWALVDGQAALPNWVLAQVGAAWSALERELANRSGPPASALATVRPVSGPTAKQPTGTELAPMVQPPAANPIAAMVDVPPRPVVTTVPPAAATDAEGEPGVPLPPPTVDPTDPYQIRAEAVGLHPGLSRVLLARLSPADYRNAGVAIETAVAQTPDGGVLVWPRQRTPEQALFQVRFVRGAAPGCRRYVVSVTKDGWLTTAPPMEKCGTQRPPRPGRG
jgi:hypothetical protein